MKIRYVINSKNLSSIYFFVIKYFKKHISVFIKSDFSFNITRPDRI